MPASKQVPPQPDRQPGPRRLLQRSLHRHPPVRRRPPSDRCVRGHLPADARRPAAGLARESALGARAQQG